VRLPEYFSFSHCCRLPNHGPTTVVSRAHADRRNVMAASWTTPLDLVPPKVLLKPDKATLKAASSRRAKPLPSERRLNA
jgi:flavin reductase (DIM6/NTAB) family NADH-FMN oxidoreductase RutF